MGRKLHARKTAATEKRQCDEGRNAIWFRYYNMSVRFNKIQKVVGGRKRYIFCTKLLCLVHRNHLTLFIGNYVFLNGQLDFIYK